jgi:transposase
MDEKKQKEPKDWREARRLQAWELKQKGWKQKDIAEALGVSKGAVSQWFKKAESEGVEALRKRKGGGPKPRLSAEQVNQLPALLSQGAEHFGFRGEVWTRARGGTAGDRRHRAERRHTRRADAAVRGIPRRDPR